MIEQAIGTVRRGSTLGAGSYLQHYSAAENSSSSTGPQQWAIKKELLILAMLINV